MFLFVSAISYQFLSISVHIYPFVSKSILFVHSCALILAHMGWLHVRHEFGLQWVETVVVPKQSFPLISEMGNSEYEGTSAKTSF